VTRILIVQAHPDAGAAHLCHALAAAHAEGAAAVGSEVRTVNLGRLDVPLLRSRKSWENERGRAAR